LYANGLSSSLPLQLNSGKYNADINYDVTSTTFDPEYLSFYDASTIMIYVPKMYQQNTNNYNPQTYINAVNSCYQD
jgi:hypothetical protein